MNAKEMRIVYMGTPDFAVEPLRLLTEGGYHVTGVVTVPDKPAGRGLKMQESAVKRYAVSKGLTVLQPERLKDEQWLREFRERLRPDLCIVVAFRMLPEVVWGWPKYGTFNLHASLLPDYRGAAPINRAVMNGERKTGVTTFFLNDRIDCGAIIRQREVEIAQVDTAGDVHDKLMEAGGRLVVETVEAIALAEGKVQVVSQDDGDCSDCRVEAKPAPKIFKADCELDFRRPVREVYNQVRGLAPYPGAWCQCGLMGKEGATTILSMKVLSSHYEEVDRGAGEAGRFESDGILYLRVWCGDDNGGGWLYVDRLQVAGKRAMEVGEFLRGLRGYRF